MNDNAVQSIANDNVLNDSFAIGQSAYLQKNVSIAGRMFEGQPNIMLRSIDNFLKLPDTALLWPGMILLYILPSSWQKFTFN